MLVNGRLERSVARFGVVRLAVVLALGALWVAFAVLSLWSTNTLLHLDVDSFLSQPGMSAETRAQLAQAAFVLRSLKAISWQVMATVGLLASALFAVVLIVVARMFRAQSISLWGLKVEASTEAAQLAERVYLAERTLAALAENIGEFQSLQFQMNALVRFPTEARFLDSLDAVAQTAAFTMRPMSRAVRVSVWLYRHSARLMRIIASYRVASQSRETFEMPREPPSGFAALVLREQRPVIKREGFTDHSGEWKEDRTETHGTVSILGAPIEVDHGEWGAVLCFSTDREEDAFSDEDRPQALYFASVASTLLSLALTSEESPGQTAMLDLFWNRYRRDPA